ncbi:hypothetical protein AX774_g4062 [Zancudomyces culisetae]|uniref:Uncharacterized protein n=1 Tax=Zancudomyces culisetae TaxID=1213189 RepID=A0A1R1PNA4_ZANCU|nr:hypothetical protein AX774_g7975 [Zancudomyces culisetae]OMH82447.1 hypothetical protein AX774_g4062 [Zancudomyces culisetae]|eukprot:OMH78643.1 hypothetical protein AX774_g7975 [Zancudomyces culisetae]
MGRVDDIILKCKAEVGGIDQYLKSLATLLVEFIYWNEEYSNNRKDPKPIQDGETDIDLISLGIRNIDIDNEYIAATNRESDENCFASDISSPPKGVILSGESGCGKSKLAETLAGMGFFSLSLYV